MMTIFLCIACYLNINSLMSCDAEPIHGIIFYPQNTIPYDVYLGTINKPDESITKQKVKPSRAVRKWTKYEIFNELNKTQYPYWGSTYDAKKIEQFTPFSSQVKTEESNIFLPTLDPNSYFFLAQVIHNSAERKKDPNFLCSAYLMEDENDSK